MHVYLIRVCFCMCMQLCVPLRVYTVVQCLMMKNTTHWPCRSEQDVCLCKYCNVVRLAAMFFCCRHDAVSDIWRFPQHTTWCGYSLCGFTCCEARLLLWKPHVVRMHNVVCLKALFFVVITTQCQIFVGFHSTQLVISTACAVVLVVRASRRCQTDMLFKFTTLPL